ncbi:hypothetical protein JXA56_00640 [Candidatus Micrarchaeota archaeon]|nr:hypothetical protein [Candidatus Micrarchaeota archaeon]
MKYYVVEPCTTANGFEIKLKKRIDIGKAEHVFSKLGEIIASSPVVLLVKIKDYSASVYASGRIMIKSERKMEKKEADDLAREIVPELESGGII